MVPIFGPLCTRSGKCNKYGPKNLVQEAHTLTLSMNRVSFCTETQIWTNNNSNLEKKQKLLNHNHSFKQEA